jgi:hypothetical protein
MTLKFVVDGLIQYLLLLFFIFSISMSIYKFGQYIERRSKKRKLAEQEKEKMWKILSKNTFDSELENPRFVPPLLQRQSGITRKI